MAVAGRADSKLDPPYIIWVMRFGRLRGSALRAQAPSSIAMGAMSIDPNQGADWLDREIAGRQVLVGHSGMVHQDDHHRGWPVVYLTIDCIYALIAAEDGWIEEVVASLPASGLRKRSKWRVSPN